MTCKAWTLVFPSASCGAAPGDEGGGLALIGVPAGLAGSATSPGAPSSAGRQLPPEPGLAAAAFCNPKKTSSARRRVLPRHTSLPWPQASTAYGIFAGFLWAVPSGLPLPFRAGQEVPSPDVHRQRDGAPLSMGDYAAVSHILPSLSRRDPRAPAAR